MSRLDHDKPYISNHWMKRTLIAAGIYNLLWGAAVILAPRATLNVIGLTDATYPQLWQCIGMIVGVYGLGYLAASANPTAHWPITLVGLLGKILGPIGFVIGVAQGQLPGRMLITIITNDLIWWIPFTLIMLEALRTAPQRHQGSHLFDQDHLGQSSPEMHHRHGGHHAHADSQAARDLPDPQFTPADAHQLTYVRYVTSLDAPIDDVYQRTADPHQLDALTPAWIRFIPTDALPDHPDQLRQDMVIRYRFKLFGVPMPWSSRLSHWRGRDGFAYDQHRGPFAVWRHEHQYVGRDGVTWMIDDVWYRLRLGALGRTVAGRIARQWVDAIFAHRHAVLQAHARSHQDEPGQPEMMGIFSGDAVQ